MRKFKKGEHHITRICDSSVLILIFSGVLRFTEDGKDTELVPGEYYIQRQGLYQEGKRASDSPEYFYIHFDGSFCNDKNGLPIRGRFDIRSIMGYVEKLEKMYFSPNKNKFAINGLFYSILGCLGICEFAVGTTKETAYKIENYILHHFTENSLSMQDIKDKFNFSEDYIIRSFKTVFSITPHKYITLLRIKYAKQLMLSTSRPLGIIAAECGYGDYSLFYKNFVRETGKSPSEWSAK